MGHQNLLVKKTELGFGWKGSILKPREDLEWERQGKELLDGLGKGDTGALRFSPRVVSPSL